MGDSSAKLIVAITQRIDDIIDRSELRDALDQRLVKWIIQAGFLPVVIPNILLESNTPDSQPQCHLLETWLQTIKPNAFLLSGGNDIGDYPERDATEQYLLSWAESRKLPVLGVCRGLQMMASWAGTKLLRIDGHVKTRHSLNVLDNNEEWPSNVNSYHNLALASCPDGFEVTAESEDGSIEAIRHIKLPWEGWMWHPERESTFSKQDMLRVKRLLGG